MCPQGIQGLLSLTLSPALRLLMSKRTSLFRLTLIVLLAGAGLVLTRALLLSGASADWNKGLAAYERGDHATALGAWQPLAEQGIAMAQHNLGLMYREAKGVSKDDKMAAEWYERAAEQGYADAQNNLGLMYHAGEGVAQDYKTAMQWFRRAAEQGQDDARNSLGAMYAQGQGVPQDYKAAAEWYRRAAEQGHAGAQNNLGGMYYTGKGMAEDYVYAHMWVHIAVSGGEKDSDKLRSFILQKAIEEEMTPSQIAEAQALARECVRKAYKDC